MVQVIPAGASAVVTTDNHHNNNNCDDMGDRYRNHDRFAQVSRDIKDAVRESIIATTTTGAAGVLATTATGAAGVLATKDSRFEVVQEMTKGFTAGALAACENTDEIVNKVVHGTEVSLNGFSMAQKQLSDSATATLVGFKDLTALSYQVEGRSLLEAAKNAAALSIQSDRNFAASQLQAQTFASAQALQAQTIASAAVLQAQQIASAAAAQAAECCCELKEKITCDGDKTRALINGIELQNQRDRAAKAEQLLAAYYSAKSVPVVP